MNISSLNFSTDGNTQCDFNVDFKDFDDHFLLKKKSGSMLCFPF